MAEQLKELVELIATGELTQEELADTLEGIEGMFDQKVENVCYVLRDLDATTAAIDAEIGRLQARKKTLVNSTNHLKDYLRFAMSSAEIKKVKTPLWSVTLIPAKPMVVIDDADQIPDRFKKTHVEIKVDKKALLMALADEQVEGAHLGESQLGLRIA
jgi:hypothetical protein